ncbi:MAG: trypsin-like peptidase domain-containing protein [Myxococcales bacterium]|nr:trypsin-like peptidase domain-containing protein [Myxococcales bacterium]
MPPMQRPFRAFPSLFFVGLLFFSAFTLSSSLPSVSWAAKKLTVQDILLLVEVGYSEEQLIQQIEQANMRGKFNLTPLQALQLRKKGLSPKLIRWMGIAGFKQRTKPTTPVTIDMLKMWLKQKKPEAWVRAQLKARGIRHQDFSTMALLELNQEGLSITTLQLIYKLKKQANTAKNNAPPTTNTPPARQVPPTTQDPTGQPLFPPMPSARQNKRKRPISEREKLLLKRPAESIATPKDGLYRHITNLYQVQLPTTWRILEEIDPQDTRPVSYFSSQATKRPRTLRQGFSVHVEFIGANESLKARPAQEIARIALHNHLENEDELRIEKKLHQGRFLQYEAGIAEISGKERTHLHRLRSRYIFLWSHKKMAFVIIRIFASPQTFASFVAQATQILKSFRLLDPKRFQGTPRLQRSMTRQQVIQSKISATVSISCQARNKQGQYRMLSGGSGFVVTPDGYVVTNHHVVFNTRTGRYYDRLMVNWDRSAGRGAIRARVIGAYAQGALRDATKKFDIKSGRIRSFQRKHVDIALLKLEGDGPYPYTQLSSVHAASLGDNVVAMGFPLEGSGISSMGTEDITATSGAISRLVRLPNGQVNEIQHTAKVAGGNSGGPLYDLDTGTAIGINTWVGIFDKSQQRPGMGLGYYYAIPIDLAWAYFPDYLARPKGPLSAQRWNQLGVYWISLGYEDAAIRAFRRSIQKDPSIASSYAGLAQIYLNLSYQRQDSQQDKLLQKARELADKGLQQDPEYPTLLELLAGISLQKRDYSTTTYLINKMIQQQPGYYSPYIWRADLYQAQGQLKKALADAETIHRLTRGVLPDGYSKRGQILFAAGRYYESIQAYRKAQRIAPHDIDLKISEHHGQLMLKQYTTALPQLEALTERYPFHPYLYSILLEGYTNSQQYLKGWSAYIGLLKSKLVQNGTPQAYALYQAGLCVDRGFVGELRKRKPLYLFGTWGHLFGTYSRSRLAYNASTPLLKMTRDLGLHGISYGLLRILESQASNEKIRRGWHRIAQRFANTPISLQEWKLLSLSQPMLSNALLVKLFVLTPSVLDQATFVYLIKHGLSSGAAAIMLKLSIARLKKGMRPLAAPHPNKYYRKKRTRRRAQRSPSYRTNSVPPYRTRVKVFKHANMLFKAVQTNDFDIWRALIDPYTPQQKSNTWFRILFYVFAKGTIREYTFAPYSILWAQHPRLGRLVKLRYYLVRHSGQREVGYWHFRNVQGRWLLTFP